MWCCEICNLKGLRSATPPIEPGFLKGSEERSRKPQRIGSSECSTECSNEHIPANKQDAHYRSEVNHNPEEDQHFAALNVWQAQEKEWERDQSRRENSGLDHHRQDRQEHKHYEQCDKAQERDGSHHQGRGQAAPAVAQQENRQQTEEREQERPPYGEAQTRDMGELLRMCQDLDRWNSDNRSEEKRGLEAAIEKRDQTIRELLQTIQQQDQTIKERDEIIEKREELVLSLQSRHSIKDKEWKELQGKENELRKTCKIYRDKLIKVKQMHKEEEEKVNEEQERMRDELKRLQEARKRKSDVLDFD